MTTVKDLFGLKSEVSFINVNTERDTQLYIDPIMMEVSPLSIHRDWLEKVSLFWKYALSVLDEENGYEKAIKLFSYMPEDNSNHLGMSQKKSIGKSIGRKKAKRLVDSILSSQALRGGLLGNIIDLTMFIEGIGPDNLSDMITGILKKELCEYTRQECSENDTVTMRKCNMKHYRDSDTLSWKKLSIEMPIDEQGKPILLTPKCIVSDYDKYNGWRYFNLILLGEKVTEGTTKLEQRQFVEYSLSFNIEETEKAPELLKKYRIQVVDECKEMVKKYGTHIAVFCTELKIGKAMLRSRSFKELEYKQMQLRKKKKEEKRNTLREEAEKLTVNYGNPKLRHQKFVAKVKITNEKFF